MKTLLATKTKVLSVQIPPDGNKVYGKLLRRAFAESEEIDFRAYWTDDKRELPARVLNTLLRQRIPLAWAIARNVDLRRVRGELGYALYSRRLVQRLRREHAVDVLHFNTQTAALLAVDLMKQTPAVITLDQTAVQAALETDKRWRWTHAPGIALERAPFRAAAAVVPFSGWAANALIDAYGVDPARIHVIPVGVDRGDFAEIAARRGDADGRPLKILFVGGEFARKGGPLLVEVFLQRFAGRGVELHLMTGAPGIVEHPQIHVHRGVAAFSPEWKQLYAQADVFALPTHREAFGIAFIEAMAAGLPVIGTAISAIPEIVADGETGFLIPRNDGQALAERLDALLSNAELRGRLGANGPPRVARYFDVAANMGRLKDVFRAVAGHRPASHP